MDYSGYKAIDLFAGAGGFSLAASNLGMSILAAVEFDKEACETYQANIVDSRTHHTKLYNQDILDISPETLRDDLKLEKGELDLLMGGPPCQGFSSHRIHNSGVDDPRNSLLIRYFDFVEALEPRAFLVENVPGLMWKRHELYLQKFKSLSHKNGYKLLGPIKINAKDYGVPQNRNRVFMLGVRSDQVSGDISWPPPKTHSELGSGLPEWLNASTVFEEPPKNVLRKLEELIGDSANNLKFGSEVTALAKDPSAIHMIHTEELIKRFSNTPINGSRKDLEFRLPCHSNGYRGHLDVYGRIRLAQPGPTITTGCFNPSKGRFLHPWKNHGITVRHAARFQTFPDDYVFIGGITSQGKQVGNAVPIKLGEVMIKTALESISHPQESELKEDNLVISSYK